MLSGAFLATICGDFLSAETLDGAAVFEALQRKTGSDAGTGGTEWEAAEELWKRDVSGTAPAEDLQVPLEHHPDGTVKTILRAESAGMPPGGYVRARKVYVESYDEHKTLFGIIYTERCIFDPSENRALGLGRVRLQHRGLRVRGSNVLWHSSEQLVKIFNAPEVRIQASMIDQKPGKNP